MQRICRTLSKAGHEVTLVGRKQRSSVPVVDEPYNQKRIVCLFEKGFLFYAEYNIRLFFYLLNAKADVVCSIDLDTLGAATLATFFRSFQLVYDAHEHFTEMEEVIRRPLVKAVWKTIERWSIPHVSGAYTVSQTIADDFNNQYGIEMSVVRNMAVFDEAYTPVNNFSKRTILYQGAVNEGRGLFQLAEAMHQVDAQLLICGKGSIYNALNEFVVYNNLQQKVKLLGYVKPVELLAITRKATVGITLFEAMGRSNYFSLANRYFDYLQAGIPQIAMNYPEYRNLNNVHEVACLIDDVKTPLIAAAMNKLLEDTTYFDSLHKAACAARQEWNWQQESEKLTDFYARLSLM
jgi:glycosyltransferase involved in cell wall biosynthesis